MIAKTVHDTTEWSQSGLPPELQHEDVRFYREVGGHGQAYQIGFENTWMPFSYDVPDRYEITHARLERHADPEDSVLKRLMGAERQYLVIVVCDTDAARALEVYPE